MISLLPHLILLPASILSVAGVNPLVDLIKETTPRPGSWQTKLLLLELLLLLLSQQRGSGPQLRG